MTKEELFKTLKDYFEKLIMKNNLDYTDIKITSKALTPKEAIGFTKRKDFPIIVGKESMLQAQYLGDYGQAFTDAPSIFEGNIKEILELDIINDHYSRGLFIATLNAVMCNLGLIRNTIHCKNKEPELCAKKFVEYINDNYCGKKIALVGYQPAILEALSEKFNLRVLDLNQDNIGKTRYGILIEDGVKDYKEVVLKWADCVLCTGSTLCNGSIVDFIDIGKEVLFFGTTAAGACKILDLKRVCFYSA